MGRRIRPSASLIGDHGGDHPADRRQTLRAETHARNGQGPRNRNRHSHTTEVKSSAAGSSPTHDNLLRVAADEAIATPAAAIEVVETKSKDAYGEEDDDGGDNRDGGGESNVPPAAFSTWSVEGGYGKPAPQDDDAGALPVFLLVFFFFIIARHLPPPPPPSPPPPRENRTKEEVRHPVGLTCVSCGAPSLIEFNRTVRQLDVVANCQER